MWLFTISAKTSLLISCFTLFTTNLFSGTVGFKAEKKAKEALYTPLSQLELEKRAREQAAFREKKSTNLHHAAESGRAGDVSLLLNLKACPNLIDDKGMTPVHLAAWHGHEKVVQVLVESKDPKVMIDLKDNNKQTALHKAAYKGHDACAKLLLEHGTDKNAVDQDRWTPLHWATRENKLSTVKLLIAYLANVDAQDSQRRTPLWITAVFNRNLIATELMKAGADPTLAGQHGDRYHTPATIARIRKHVGLALVLDAYEQAWIKEKKAAEKKL